MAFAVFSQLGSCISLHLASYFSLKFVHKMSKASLFIAIAALLAQSGDAYTKEALADKVVNLPGAEKLDIKFNQFSGFLDVPGNSGNSKHLHYWLVCLLACYKIIT